MIENLYLIAGMHRCGTSVLTKILGQMGLDLPESIQAGGVDNPKGHFESWHIVQKHDDILKDLHLSWNDWFKIPNAWWTSLEAESHVAELMNLLDHEFQNPDVVLKDPRLSLLMPLWHQCTDRMKIKNYSYIICFRHPWEVACSLSKRNMIDAPQSYLLWLHYLLSAEFHSRGHKRAFIQYPNWGMDVVANLERLSRQLDVHWAGISSELLQDFDINLLHHHTENHQKIETPLSPLLKELCLSVMASFMKLTIDPYNKDAIKNCDTCRLAFADYVNNNLQQQLALHELSLRSSELKSSTESSIQSLSDHLSASQETLKTYVQDSELQNKLLAQKIIGVDDNLKHVMTLNTQMFEWQRNEVVALKRELSDVRQQHKVELDDLRQRQDIERSDSIKQYKVELDDLRQQHRVELDDLRQRQDIERSDAKQQHEDMLQQIEHLKNAHQSLNKEYSTLHLEFLKEQKTVFRPLCRKIYSGVGRSLRKFLPHMWVDTIKGKIPNPDGIPHKLHATLRPTRHLQPAANFGKRSMMAHPDIFVLSIINWNFRFQRPQQLSQVFSHQGRRVFYIEMELADGGLEVCQIDTNLYRVRLPSTRVGAITAYQGKATPRQVMEWLEELDQFCNMIQATSFKQVIIEHPFWWQFMKHVPPEFQIIYDCMDDIGGFSNTLPFILDLEHDLLSSADKVVVSAQNLADKTKSVRSSVLIRNATNLDHFINHDQGKDVLSPFLEPSDARIQVGYIGAIAEWFDADLLRSVAEMDEGIHIHLCGAVTASAPAQLNASPNITLHGEISYEQVPLFLDQMEVMLIPFKLIPIIQCCDPVKFYEHCSMGKPTVSTPLPELQRVGDLCFFASDPPDFLKAIRLAHVRGKDEQYQKLLKNFAKDNTWEERAHDFLSTLDEHPKVSVIILSYGDPDFTLAALTSLHESGPHYPNQEVIVVDNGSSPKALNILHKACADYSDTRLVENGSNLGFAKGNNVGIEQSTGDYVLLLNNDTYLSPGAIFAMMNHLKSNISCGAVGPLTNNIGNEAKVELFYNDMDEMKMITRPLLRGYRGVGTRLRVLAYFAVMFRRKDLFDTFGLLSEDFGLGMFEDDDHCARIQNLGYDCILAEDAFIHHHLSATFSLLDNQVKKKLFEDNQKIYETKWGPWIPHAYRHERPKSSFD